MRPTVWQPPIETTAGEDKIIKGIKRAKLCLFLRRHRHQLFSSEFQVELATIRAATSDDGEGCMNA
jgi:hypothetical protein